MAKSFITLTYRIVDGQVEIKLRADLGVEIRTFLTDLDVEAIVTLHALTKTDGEATSRVVQKSPKSSLEKITSQVRAWPSYLRTISSAKVARTAKGESDD